MKKPKPVELPDLAFKSDVARWEGKLTPCSLLDDDEKSLAEEVLKSTPLNRVDWATLFAYMHRRFGPPHVAGDDFKDLSAGWMLSSPDPRVFVSVSPSLSGARFSFTPYYQKNSGDSPAPFVLELSNDRIGEVKAAYRTTLLDLLRPVCVRDQKINALGKLGDSELANQLYDFEHNTSRYEVKQHSSSGYPMPLGLFGGKDWGALSTIIQSLGKGDSHVGRMIAVDKLRKDVFVEAAMQTREVKRLMLMAHHAQRPLLQQGLRISDPDMEVFNAELTTLAGKNAGDSSLVDELKPEDVAKAVEFLNRLGLSSHALERDVRLLQTDRSTVLSFRALQDIAGDDFPDGAIPDSPFDTGFNLATHMKTVFEISERPELSNWLDTTMSRPSGASALARIVAHVHDSLKRAKNRPSEKC